MTSYYRPLYHVCLCGWLLFGLSSFAAVYVLLHNFYDVFRSDNRVENDVQRKSNNQSDMQPASLSVCNRSGIKVQNDDNDNDGCCSAGSSMCSRSSDVAPEAAQLDM
jgi:hypothetical protein